MVPGVSLFLAAAHLSRSDATDADSGYSLQPSLYHPTDVKCIIKKRFKALVKLRLLQLEKGVKAGGRPKQRSTGVCPPMTHPKSPSNPIPSDARDSHSGDIPQH